jgi:hypothetical protein
MTDNGPCNCAQSLALQEGLDRANEKLAELTVDLLSKQKQVALLMGDDVSVMRADGWLDLGMSDSAEGKVRAFLKKIDVYSVRIGVSSDKVYVGVSEDLGEHNVGNKKTKFASRWFDYVHRVDPACSTIVNIQTAVKAAFTTQKTISDVLQAACWNL